MSMKCCSLVECEFSFFALNFALGDFGTDVHTIIV